MKILAIGPHPDDVEIGMGGTILALRAQGHEVTICDLTNGEPTPIGTPERRARETADAARILFDASAYLERKIDAIRAYASQFGPERGNERFFDDLRTWGRYYGDLIGRDYGEPFACREEIGLTGLDQFV